MLVPLCSSLSARSKVSVASIGGTGRLPPHLLATPATGQTFSRRRSMCSLALDDTRPKPLRETRARGWRMSMAPVAEGIFATPSLESTSAFERLDHLAPSSPSGTVSTTPWKSCQAASVLADICREDVSSSTDLALLGMKCILVCRLVTMLAASEICKRAARPRSLGNIDDVKR